MRNHKSFTAKARALADAEQSKALVGELQTQLQALDEYVKTLPEQASKTEVDVHLDTNAITDAIDKLQRTLTQPRRVKVEVIRDTQGRLERIVATTQGPPSGSSKG